MGFDFGQDGEDAGDEDLMLDGDGGLEGRSWRRVLYNA